MSDILSALSAAVIEGKKDEIAQMAQQALDAGLPAQEIIDNGLMKGMDYVAAQFRAGDIFVPEVMRSARAMLNAMDILKPILTETGVQMAGKVLLGTVKGDLHDIGKNLVRMMCEGAGLEVRDLGISVSAEDFVAAVKEVQPDIVGMSALLTTTMRAMGDTIQALEEAGLRDQVKIMVGGAPVTQEFADKIGADGYGPNAAAASDLAKQFVKKP